MKTENASSPPEGAEDKSGLAQTLEEWNEACQNCNPLTPILCVTGCNIWKLKNEFRELYEKMKNPGFMVNLLNTLKNKRRIQILKIISEGRHSIGKLQQELKKSGYYHSQKTIIEEYINPLVEIGLADEVQNQYYATTFGSRLDELMKDLCDFEDVLPPHSECYEETTLNMLRSNPKTFEDLKSTISAKSVARVLGRLQRKGLVEATKEKGYIFYFRTRRAAKKAKFSLTERRVYESIPIEGASAGKLAENAKVSLRRTYKYLRRLRGKKMVFARKSPKSYSLTPKGAQVSAALLELHNLAAETLDTAMRLIKNNATHDLLSSYTSLAKRERKEKEVVPLTIIRYTKED